MNKQLDTNKLKKAYDKIVFNTPQSLKENEKVNVNPKKKCKITKVNKGDRNFRNGFNRFGEMIILKEPHEKFSIPFNLFTKNDLKEFKEKRHMTKKPITIESLKKRGEKNRKGIIVFLNNKKIRDSEIQISVFNGVIDVYVPSRLFKEKDSTIVFYEEKYNAYNEYFCEEISFSEKMKIIIPEKFKDSLNIFDMENGKCIENNKYSFEKIDGKYILKSNFLNEKRIEIRSTGFIAYEETIDLRDNIFKLPDEFSYPISKDIIEFYYNGEKIEDDIIKELPDNKFLFNHDLLPENNNLHLIIHNNHVENEEQINYTDKYKKLFDLIKYEKLKDILLKRKDYKGIPSYISLEEMLNSYPGINFDSPDPVWNMQNENIQQKLLTLIKKYINKNSHYFSIFLKQFLLPEENFKFKYKDKQKFERLDTSNEFSSKKIFKFKKPVVVYFVETELDNLIIKVNNRLIPTDDYTIIKTPNFNKYFIYIKSSRIKDDDEVIITARQSIPFNYQIQEYKTSDLNYKFKLNGIILEKELIDFAYLTENETEFRVLPKDFYNLEVTDEYYNVTFKEKINCKKIMCYSPFFTTRKTLVVPEGELKDKIFYSIGTPDKETGLIFPCFSSKNYKCNIEVYHNGKLLTEGKDFRLLSPSINNDLKEQQLMLNFIPKTNDIIDMIFKEHKEKVVFYKEEIESDYGFVYLNNLKYPFSFDYLSVYINGVKLSKNNIDIISDNIIKIKNVNSFKNLAIVENTFVDNFTILDLYREVMNNHITFEGFIRNEVIKKKVTLDQWFEKLDEQKLLKDPLVKVKHLDDLVDDDNDGIIITKDGDIILDVSDNKEHYDYAMETLVEALITGVISRRIDANKPDPELSKQDFYKYFIEDIIKIDANSYSIFTEAIIDANNLYLTRTQVAEKYARELANGEAQIDENGNVMDTDPIYNYIYKENEIIIDTNNETDAIILDANIGF